MTVTPTSIPPYSIVAFCGTAVPAGWFICDGTNGTPDLRNRFILGASTLDDVSVKSQNPASGSGSAQRSCQATTSPDSSAITVDVNGTTLTSDQLPPLSGNLTGSSSLYMTTNKRAKVKDASGDAYLLFTSYNNTQPTGESDWDIQATNILTDGGGKAHTHTATATAQDHTHTVDTIGPYYILFFIMKAPIEGDN
ncbi:hypothetical protein [Martelella sp. FOR1707]